MWSVLWTCRIPGEATGENFCLRDSVAYLSWSIAGIIALALAVYRPRFGDVLFQPIEKCAALFARRKALAIVTLGGIAVLSRLALLGIMPVPVPSSHDEFSYLLAADTFAHGRLTNPPHSLWIFLDTFHVLDNPSYASIFPPAQGAVLALGQLLGHPWIGVLLTMAAMCMAVTWMLQQWFPSKWALLGGVLVLLRLDLFTYWLESYFGGAVAAIGGALVMGAFPRILRRQRKADVFLMALGIALLANSRPLEGLVFCFPIAAGLLICSLSKRGPSFRITTVHILFPLISVLSATAVFMGYYNWRVTGNALELPHALYDREYVNFPVLVWQTPGPTFTYANPQFESYFNGWVRNSRVKFSTWAKCVDFWKFFLHGALSIPLLTLPWLIRDRRIRILLLQFCFSAIGLLCVTWFLAHYAAPLTATIFAILVQGMRHLRRWEIGGKQTGVFLTRLVVVLLLVRVSLHLRQQFVGQERWSLSRAKVAAQLQSLPGEQLAVVRYSSQHDAAREWVYNSADIDHSKVVWAREIPGLDPTPLFKYFSNRKVWLVEADSYPVRLRPFDSQSDQQSSLSSQYLPAHSLRPALSRESAADNSSR